jgi:hypothetical protein
VLRLHRRELGPEQAALLKEVLGEQLAGFREAFGKARGKAAS